MKVHPLTLEFLRAASPRPGMFMQDFDLHELEVLVCGFEAGLQAAGVMKQYKAFNVAFEDFLRSAESYRFDRGWAEPILERYGQTQRGFREFLSLVEKANAEGTEG